MASKANEPAPQNVGITQQFAAVALVDSLKVTVSGQTVVDVLKRVSIESLRSLHVLQRQLHDLDNRK